MAEKTFVIDLSYRLQVTGCSSSFEALEKLEKAIQQGLIDLAGHPFSLSYSPYQQPRDEEADRQVDAQHG